MYVLGEMLTPDLRVQVLRGATALEMNGLSVRQGGKRGHEIALFPMGRQEVPIAETDWDYNMAKRGWDQNQFARHILEGLKRAHTKTLNYAKLNDIEQGEKETPGKFLYRLWEALHKFTDVDSESQREK